MKRLPKWCITDKFPALYDTESATAIEMTAKVYGAMNELIDDYNAWVDKINAQIEAFENAVEKDYEVFKVAMRQEFQDFINVVDLKMKEQDKEIADAVDYMKTNLRISIKEMIAGLRVTGELNADILAVFDDFAKQISDEATARQNADNDLQTAFDNEATARQNTDNDLQTAIDNEATTRQNADNDLQTAIDNEATARQNADNDLQTAIDNEATARQNAIKNVNETMEMYKHCLTPQMYGAKGDGTTDDTEAINATITAHNETGLPVYFPKGKYKVTGALTEVTTAGDIFGTGEIIGTGTTDVSLLTIKAKVRVDGLTFTVEDYKSVIVLNSCRSAIVEHCVINSNTSFGVHIYNSLLCSIKDCYIIHCPKCIYISSNGGDTGDNYFTGNTFDTSDGTGKCVLYFESGGGIRFLNNKILSYALGLDIRSGANTSVMIVDGNSMENGSTALYLNNSVGYGRIVFSNNQLSNMKVIIENNAYEVGIIGNIFTGARVSNSVALTINNSGGCVSFQNNVVKGYNYSVMCYNPVDNLIVSGNNCDDFCKKASINSKAIFNETYDKTATCENIGFTIAKIKPNTNGSCIVEITLNGVVNEYLIARLVDNNGTITMELIHGSESITCTTDGVIVYPTAVTGDTYINTIVRGTLTLIEH